MYVRFTQTEGDTVVGEHTGNTDEVAIDVERPSDPDDKLEIIVAYMQENDEVQVRVGNEIVWSELLSEDG